MSFRFRIPAAYRDEILLVAFAALVLLLATCRSDRAAGEFGPPSPARELACPPCPPCRKDRRLEVYTTDQDGDWKCSGCER